MEAKDEQNHDHFDEPNDFISMSSSMTLETPISEGERQSLCEEITKLLKEKNEFQDRASLFMLPFSIKLNQKTCPLLPWNHLLTFWSKVKKMMGKQHVKIWKSKSCSQLLD